LVQEEGIESLSQSHRRSRISAISGEFVKKACRGDIACGERRVTAR
jgi:hypothetical protein